MCDRGMQDACRRRGVCPGVDLVCLPDGFEFAVGFGELFGEDAGFSDDRQEVGIADPAGEQVHVDVFGNTGSGCLAQVHPDIDALWAIDFADVTVRGSDEGEEFVGGRVVDALEGVGVVERDHHEMSGGVGVAVEDYVVQFTAVDDEGFLVIARLGQVTKYTTV